MNNRKDTSVSFTVFYCPKHYTDEILLFTTENDFIYPIPTLFLYFCNLYWHKQTQSKKRNVN